MAAQVKEHAVLVPTSQGPAGAVVCEPTGRSRATAMLLHTGGRSGRAGFNSEWANLSRRLCALGITVMRLDFGTEADSLMIGEKSFPFEPGDPTKNALDSVLLQDATAWFQERAGGHNLIVIGTCYGARLGLVLAAERKDVVATILVVPFLRRNYDHERTTWRGWSQKAQGGQSLADLDRAQSDPEDRIDPSVVAQSESALRRGPMSILVGEKDPDDPVALERTLSNRDFELAIEPGVAFYPGHLPDIQELVSARIIARVDRTLSSLGAAS